MCARIKAISGCVANKRNHVRPLKFQNCYFYYEPYVHVTNLHNIDSIQHGT